MHRNYLAFRRRTHISQKLYENYLNRMQEFSYHSIKFRIKYGFDLNAIANMDKTPLYLSMPLYKIVQKIGSKKVNRTQGQEDWSEATILTVPASGEKLPPLCILKQRKPKIPKRNHKS